MFNAKNGRLRLHGAVMDYILFGKGEKDLVMILGGGQDRTLGVEGSYALQEAIPNSRLRVWEDYGHALYDEASDFDDVVLGLLQE